MRTIIFLFFFAASLNAYDRSPPCYLDLEKSFFRTDWVLQALSMNLVMQGQWDAIAKGVVGQQGGIPAMVRERANRMSPNPFDPKFIPEQVKEIFLEAAFSVFRDVVYSNGYSDPTGIKSMFDYIVARNEIRLNQCFGKPK